MYHQYLYSPQYSFNQTITILNNQDSSIIKDSIFIIYHSMDKLFNLAKRYPNIAYIYAITGNTIFALMQICFKKASQILTPFQLLVIRSFFLIMISLIMLKRQNKSPYILSPETFKLVLVRISIVTSATSTMYYSIKYIPISLANTLLNTGPLIIFFIQAYHYKKPIKFANFMIVILSFIGIVFIIQPQFIFGEQSLPSIKNLHFYSFLVLVAAFAIALNMHFVHNLAKKVDPLVNVHYSHLGWLFTSSILGNFQPEHITLDKISIKLILLCIIIIVFSFFALYLIIIANTLRKPSHMMPFGYAGVATGFLADIYMFKIEFTYLSTIGVFLTSGGLFSEYLISRSQTEIKPNESIENKYQNEKIPKDFEDKTLKIQAK